MAFTRLAILLLLASFAAPAYGDAQDRRAERQKQQERQRYILSTRPHRLDEPLREENLTDVEVRQIQAATSVIYPGSIANIAGVTAGCPCEEGPWCDSQVWVLAYIDGRYHGLMLSRIDNQWVVGLVQNWWFTYDSFRKRYRLIWSTKAGSFQETYKRYNEEQRRQFDSFPSCRPDDEPTNSDPIRREESRP